MRLLPYTGLFVGAMSVVAALVLGCGSDGDDSNADFPDKCRRYRDVSADRAVRCGISRSREAYLREFDAALCDPDKDIDRLVAGPRYDACINDIESTKCTAGDTDSCQNGGVWRAR